jgi:hypothetical protein
MDTRKNKIPDLNEICWLRDLPKLKFLWLEENPAAMVLPGTEPLYIMARNTKGGKYHCTIDLLFDWFGISCMTTDNFCFHLQNRLIQTSQTGGQR